jgi:mono/diheme cytochrome c family protein
MRDRLPNSFARFTLIATSVLLAAVLVFRTSLLVAAGDAEATYKAKCAMCHGPDGAGATPTGKTLKVRDLRSPEVQKQSDAELNDIVGKGKNKMPAFAKSLKPDEVSGLVAFTRDLAKKK